MEDLLIDTLATFGLPVILQGSMSPEEQYPESFFTYWENEGDDLAHYDNETTAEKYNYDVNFYSSNPELVYTMLRKAKEKLESNNFLIRGNGHSVLSDEKTHIGRGMTVLYRKNK